MFATVSLNPAIDKTVYVENLEIGKVNKSTESKIDIGGKGINTAKVLKVLGAEVTSVAYLGGETGRFIEEKLSQLGVKQSNVYTKMPTRTNTKILI